MLAEKSNAEYFTNKRINSDDKRQSNETVFLEKNSYHEHAWITF